MRNVIITAFILAEVFNLCYGTMIQYENFNVFSGYRVNNVTETIKTRTASVCAAACDAKNDATLNTTCRTATFNSIRKTCELSSQGLVDTISGLGNEYKTMTVLFDCSVAPVIANGVLSIDSQTQTGSTAILTCNAGHNPLPNSPTTLECSVYSGWSVEGFGCFSTPGSSYYGTSFITGFMQNGASNYGVPTIFCLSLSGEADVTISIPFLSINELVTTVGGSLTRTYDNTVSSATSGTISAKGVSISSNVPIMLFSASIKSGGSDGSFVLPETSLGMDYIISGHPSTNAGTDEFTIIGTTDTTQVTIYFNNLQQQTVTLNRLEAYHHQAIDMSGTMISADAPVFVLSGHICANVPDNTVLYCDYIDETMPPLSSLGVVHVVSFMKPRSDFTISIVSPGLNSVSVYNDLGNLIDTLILDAQVAIFRTYTGSASISIVSDFPVLVTQYGHGGSAETGDPSMMVIPDISHYGSVYEFAVPTGFTSPSTLEIVMSDMYLTSDLLLNNSPITPSLTIPVSIPGYGIFNVIYVDVTDGRNHLSHTAGNMAQFGAWLYGRMSAGEYAWSLGITA